MSSGRDIETINPSDEFVKEYGEYFRQISGNNLSSASTAGIVIGCLLAIVFIAIVIGVIIYCRKVSAKQSAYETEEAKGSDMMDNPDRAVKYGDTGQPDIKDEVYI